MVAGPEARWIDHGDRWGLDPRNTPPTANHPVKTRIERRPERPTPGHGQPNTDTAHRPAPGPGPDDWFLDACEALGDAALEALNPGPINPLLVDKLEGCLEAVVDHEILHQRLGEVAAALAKADAAKIT
jgi:hypothetical protein